jgi:hypothetical protein
VIRSAWSNSHLLHVSVCFLHPQCMQDTRAPVTRPSATSQPEVGQKQQVTLNTGSNCQLAVAFYPMFAYDASSGAVSGTATDSGDGRFELYFDPAETYIPPLDWRTTRVLGVPIPPPLRIEIQSHELSVRPRCTGAAQESLSMSASNALTSMCSCMSRKRISGVSVPACMLLKPECTLCARMQALLS